MLCDFVLPFSGTFHPAGFPLRLATNSRDVMEAAGEAWGAWDKAFDTEPLNFRVVVQSGGESAAAGTSVSISLSAIDTQSGMAFLRSNSAAIAQMIATQVSRNPSLRATY